MGREKENLGRAKPAKQPVNPRIELMKQMVQNTDGAVPFMYRCNRCGKTALATDPTRSKWFPISFSETNIGNDCRLPVCKTCLNELYEKYQRELGNESEALRRVCMKYDIYYSPELAKVTLESSKPKERMTFYVSKTTNATYANKTYDDTITEESGTQDHIVTFEDMGNKEHVVSEETIKFWGFGFTPEDYEYLDNKYVEWSTSYPVQAKAMESIFQKICMMELQILKGIQNNEKVDALYRQLNDFMNAAGIQPKQNSENTMSDTASFGVLIKRWEDEEPIPELEDKWKDIDGIRRYISVFFFGHLAKMFGIKNNWSQLYEEEIKKYTVNRPDLEDADVNQITYEDLFGSGEDS